MNKHTIMRTLPSGDKRVAHSHHILKMLGIENGRLPEQGLAPQQIQNVKVWVAPLPPFQGSRRKQHRVLCSCPDCGVTLSLGRLQQHACKE